MLATVLQSSSGGAGAALFSLVFLVVWLGVIALFLFSNWKVWEKMGDPGWMGIVPILNLYRVFQRSRPEQAILFTIGSLIPCINLAVIVIFWIDLGKLFNKTLIHGWLTPLLAFTDATYVGPPPPSLG